MEVAGLILGGFSLVISAMENYSNVERLGRKWRRTRQEHDIDLGRVRDCELMYRLNIKALIAPLKVDGLIGSDELEVMLASLKSDNWRAQEVENALDRRLRDCRTRYFANLEQMGRTIIKLAECSKVTEDKFQSRLRKEDIKRGPVVDASRNLMLRANDRIMFEFKRINYVGTTYKRDALLADIQRCNDTLGDFLSKVDGVQQDHVVSPRGPASTLTMHQYKAVVAFWQHASRIHRLMQNAWSCTCSCLHRVYLRLDQRNVVHKVCLDLLLKFCKDSASLPTRPWDMLSLSVAHAGNSVNLASVLPSAAAGCGSSTPRVSFQLPQRALGTKIPHQAPSLATQTSSAAIANPVAGPQTMLATATANDLCFLAVQSQTMQPKDCICNLGDQTSCDAYSLIKSDASIDDRQVHTLTEVLEHRCSFRLGFRPRLTLAYNIVYWFLKLFATPWLDDAAISNSIQLPVTPDCQGLLHDQAFLLANLQASITTTQPTNETFVSLGVLLLELCFNKTLEQHSLWIKKTLDQFPYPFCGKRSLLSG